MSALIEAAIDTGKTVAMATGITLLVVSLIVGVVALIFHLDPPALIVSTSQDPATCYKACIKERVESRPSSAGRFTVEDTGLFYSRGPTLDEDVPICILSCIPSTK